VFTLGKIKNIAAE